MSTYDELFLNAMQGDMSAKESDQGDLINAKIISKGSNEYFISSGGKSEMMLPFAETIQEFQIGDALDVVTTGFKDGVPQVSQKKALLVRAREDVYQASVDNSPVTAQITKLVSNKEGNPSGYEVSVNGVDAFLPMSHVRTGSDLTEVVGKMIQVAVIKHEHGKVVVSERAIRETLQKENFSQFIQKYDLGSSIKATVDLVNDTFALLSAEGIRVFMPVSEFDWKFIKSLKDVIKSGDSFDVRVLEINQDRNSVTVSRKALVENPVDVFFRQYKEGQNLAAKVTRFARGLVIVEAPCGTEMLLPFGEISWISRVSDPKRFLNIDDRIEVKIKEMNSDNKRIIVSLRDLLENPWNQANVNYAQGSTHHGTVTSITDFGIFVSFEDGLQGLIRKEDIEWQDVDTNPADKFKKGDTVTAVVLHVDGDQEKLRLGIKQLSKNPYRNFADNYPQGSIVSGTVTKVLKDKVEVEVEGGLIAFIHVSQLSTEHVSDPSTVVKVGDTVQAVIRRMNFAQQSIELSIREMVSNEEKQEMQQYLKSKEAEIPNLGSVFGDLLKKNKK